MIVLFNPDSARTLGRLEGGATVCSERSTSAVAFICACAFLGACGGADKREAEEAYRALKSLQGQTQAGMNYMTYSAELGKTIGVVSVYLERADRDSELYKSIAQAMENFIEAKVPWEIKVSRSNELSPNSLPNSDPRVDGLFGTLEGDYGWHDDETAYVLIPGGPEIFFSNDWRGEPRVDLDNLTQIHWGLASKHLAQAGKELN